MPAEVAIELDGDEPPPLGQPLERGAQVLARLALDLGGCGDHAVQGAVFLDPFGRRLGADLVHAGDVVHRIPHQREVVDDAVGRHAELGLDAFNVQRFIAHGVDEPHVLVHQLRQVLVAGGDQHAVARGAGPLGQGADRVVRLDAGHLQHRPAQQAHHLVDGLDLPHQVFGHRRTVAFVVWIPLIAEGRPLGVEDASGMFRRELLSQAL